jgi:hypothetical protein
MRSLSREKAEFLRVLSARIVPEIADLGSMGEGRFFQIIDHALMERDPGVRRQFGVFLGVLRWAPLVRYGGPFERLTGARQDAVLAWFEDCPVALLRKGFYGQPETNAEIGYELSFDGGAGRHA